jgi:hypothetical protein
MALLGWEFYGGRFFSEMCAVQEFINRRNNGVTNLFTWSFGVQSSTNEVQIYGHQHIQQINRANILISS